MKITRLKTNHVTNPIGFYMEHLIFSYVVSESTGKITKEARIVVALDEALSNMVWDTGFCEDVSGVAWEIPMEPQPATRYYWKVFVVADDGECGESDVAFFETAKAPTDLRGDFIAAKESHAVDYFVKKVVLSEKVTHARAYATALGVYELKVNGAKAGNEFLAPGSNDYESWLPYQTIDITDLLSVGENTLELSVAPGWYCGDFSYLIRNNIYGDRKAVLCDVDIVCEDGTKVEIATDNSWEAGKVPITYSEIYHGEWQEPACEFVQDTTVEIVDFDRNQLSPRRNIPVVIKETLVPKRILHTPTGETVIDMGQNMVGWVSFVCKEPAGTKIHLQYGEIIQNGNFFRGNLGLAKAEAWYLSDGVERVVRPSHTYYGFRYVKVEGNTQEIDINDFVGEVVCSDMEQIGHLATSNELVNRLILNSLWGHKGNFVDVPTDCPQRSERMGWTGDAQAYCGTAAFQMDVFTFFSKYTYDIMCEQKKEKFAGAVPTVVPCFKIDSAGASAWSDAATIIPWTVYLYSGDKSILEQQYPSMTMWADYIYKRDKEFADNGMWCNNDFHYGDWLALDRDDIAFPTGETELAFIASCYYYMSTLLTAKAAKVLGKEEDAAKYFARAAKTKAVMQEEYFTKTGRLALSTQTGYVMALAFDICPEEYKKRVAADLYAKLNKDGRKLQTGFIGTIYLCRALSEHGYHDVAFKLLLNEDIPGWLYEVRMGATTVWERWNSIMPDGLLSSTGMNSLNHYAYGAIVEWMYRHVAGLQPLEETPGFKKVKIAPMPDYRMSHAECRYDSPAGTYEIGWWIEESGELRFCFVIPFDGSAQIVLPDADVAKVKWLKTGTKAAGAEEKNLAEDGAEANSLDELRAEQVGANVVCNVDAGTYEFIYEPTVPYQRTYGTYMTLKDMLAKEDIRDAVYEICPRLKQLPVEIFGHKVMEELVPDPGCMLSMQDVENVNKVLSQYKVIPDEHGGMIMDI